MQIKKYDRVKDFYKIKNYLSDEYIKNQSLKCWLPERFEDLVFRIDVLIEVDRKQIASQEYIYYWEENDRVVAIALADGESMYPYASNGYEYLYNDIVKYIEKEIANKFTKSEEILVITHESVVDANEALVQNNYNLQNEHDYDNFVNPQQFEDITELPDGFKLVFGDEIKDEESKSMTCHLGFHPDDEDKKIIKSFASYYSRKNSNFYPDSFEVLVMNDDELCSYAFCYINKELKTAFIEPVSTRKKYQGMGLGKAMMYSIINECKKLGITACYVNSYDWRVKFYTKSGFKTMDTLNYYCKKR